MSRKSKSPHQAIPRSESPREAGKPRPDSSNGLGSRGGGLMLGWLFALLVSRWWLPTEGVVEGLTLWLVPIVLLTAVARSAWRWRGGEAVDRWDWLDVALAWLIGAQVLSALVVVFGVGDARAALNVAWEWVGSGVLVWMLRQELRSAKLAREVCFGVSLAAAVLASYGLWQHFVWYPQMIQEYDDLLRRERRLVEAVESARSEFEKADSGRRLMELRGELARQEIPADPAARGMWEQRLKASREPIGLFALANSLAGLLTVALLIQAGMLLTLWRDPRWRGMLLVAIGVTGYCWLLTKSRTAYVGLFAGMIWWICRLWLAKPIARRGESATEANRLTVPRLVIGGVIVAAIGAIGMGVAVVTGGLDKAVLSEAPKSLKYRLEYWTSTWATIREQPWLGTGPGNFRDSYLKHKLPESSEEIADPHNFVLDVWANAGIVGLLGLLGCLAGMMWVWSRPILPHETSALETLRSATHPDTSSPLKVSAPAAWGAGVSFLVVVFGLEVFGFASDERLWWLGIVWWLAWAVAWLLSRLGELNAADASGSETVGGEVAFGGKAELGASARDDIGMALACESANVALLVHLLGAGGIAMPAIGQLLWLTVVLRAAFGCPTNSLKSASAVPPIDVLHRRLCGFANWPVQLGGATLLLAVCVWTAILPEMLCRSHLDLGELVIRNSGRGTAARDEYLLAMTADRWSLQPRRRLAELAWSEASESRLEADFEQAIKWQMQVVERAPRSPHNWRVLGEIWASRFEFSRNSAHATTAASAFEHSVERYPFHARMLADWALACEKSGNVPAARAAALRAVEQDQLNRRLGHVDKWLPDDLKSALDRIARETASRDSAGTDKPN